MPEEWRLLSYDTLDPLRTQSIFHGIGAAVDKGLAPNTLILCKPRSPLVSIGYHQELETEVNVDYAKQKGFPLVRRILGGGAVYLDRDQLFYQIVAHKSDPRVPAKVEVLFQRFLEAPVKTYNDLGVPASYRSVNDIEVNGRKISGNGAGEVGEASVLAGNIIFDFNTEEMVRILKVPSEKFRDKLYASLRERMTTIKRETKSLPDEDHVRGLLKKHYEESLKIRLMPGELSEAEIELIEKVEDTYKRPEWLNMVRERHKDLIQKRSVKVSGRSRIGEAAFKARGGLIRVLLEILDSKIRDDMITGDFSFIPASYLQKLEKMLIGSRLIPSAITDRIHSFYMRHGIQSPQVAPEDFTDAIMQAVR